MPKPGLRPGQERCGLEPIKVTDEEWEAIFGKKRPSAEKRGTLRSGRKFFGNSAATVGLDSPHLGS
jgi:hypothetical protein